MNLKCYLEKFKEITISAIESIEKDDFDSVEVFVGERENIIENISSLSYSREDFKRISNELSILKWDEKLNQCIKQKRAKIKKNMYAVKASKKASNTYNKDFYRGTTVFSQKR